METWIAIGIPLVFLAGAGLGYWFGRLDQKGWLSEQYRIACWQRDEAILQRERADARLEELQAYLGQVQREVSQNWDERYN